jgi:hypothetical protein
MYNECIGLSDPDKIPWCSTKVKNQMVVLFPLKIK